MSPRSRHPALLSVATALVAAVAVACSTLAEEPAPERTESPQAAPAPGASAADPGLARLTEAHARLTATLTAARDALQEAATAAEPAAARRAGERAVHALTAAPDLAGDLDGDGNVADPGVTPLFPGPSDQLDPDASYGDMLSRALTAAREAGTRGGPLADVLRDPVAGDLGAWQSDAAGTLAAVEEATSTAPDPAATERAIAELDGEATRALAWALLVVRAEDAERAAGFAERGVAHLGLTLDALDRAAP